MAAPRSAGIPIIPPTSAASARRAQRLARRSPSANARSIHAAAGGRKACACGLARGARSGRCRTRMHPRAARTRCDRFLSLRPAAHRRLLRRQQADERLSRLLERRHQFAPVHGLHGYRAQARIRRRHRARQLRGSGPSRPAHLSRLERRLVPPGVVSAHGREQARAWCQDRRHRSPPYRDRRGFRSASAGRAGHGHGAVLRLARPPRRLLRPRLSLYRRAYDRVRECAGASAHDRSGPRRDGEAHPLAARQCRALLRSLS